MNTVPQHNIPSQYPDKNKFYDQRNASLTPSHLDALLDQRGVLRASRYCKWYPSTRLSRREDGTYGSRWAWIARTTSGREFYKFADPKGFRWGRELSFVKDAKCFDTIYNPHGAERIRKAIADQKGVLELYAGQMDHLTRIEHNIITGRAQNNISTFGETSLNELTPFILEYGVKRLVMFPDRDGTGTKSAKMAKAMCEKLGIKFTAYELPFAMDSKQDFNDLWQQCGKSSQAFDRALADLAILELGNDLHNHKPIAQVQIVIPHKTPKKAQAKAKRIEMDWNGLHREISAHLERSYGLRRDGACLCPVHSHSMKKNEPHARLLDRSFHCYAKCKNVSLIDLAKALGIDPERYRSQVAEDQHELGYSDDTRREWIRQYHMPLTAHETINTKRISEKLGTDLSLLKRGQVIGIRSAMGSGKTHLAIDLTERVLTAGYQVIYIVHRVQLGLNITRKMRERGLDPLFYKDANSSEDFLSARVLVITIDSLHKLTSLSEFDPRRYGLCVMDEANQQLDHTINSKTLDGKEREAICGLQSLIAGARNTLALDAHLDDHTLAILGEWANEGKVHAIANEYVPSRYCTPYEYQYRDGLLSDLIKRVKEHDHDPNYREAIAFDSKHEALMVDCILTTFGIKTLTINAESAYYEDQDNALRDLDRADYTVLLYTSVIGTGFDIQRYHDHVSLIATANHLTPYDHLQMLGRARNVGGVSYYIRHKTNSVLDTEHAIAIELRDRMELSGTLRSHGNSTDSDAMDAYVSIKERKNLLRNNGYNYFVAGLCAEGYPVPKLIDHRDEAIAQMLSTIPQRLAEMELEAMDAIPHEDYHNFTDTALNELRYKQRVLGVSLIPKECTLANKKWKIYDLTGRADKETLARFALRRDITKFKKYRTYTRKLEHTIDQRERDQDRILHKRRYAVGEYRFMRRIFSAIWGSDELSEIAMACERGDGLFTPKELHERLKRAGLMDGDGMSDYVKSLLATFWGWRSNKHSNDPIDMIRFVLGRIGMKLTMCAHHRITRDGERQYRHGLDVMVYREMEHWALARDRWLERPLDPLYGDFNQDTHESAPIGLLERIYRFANEFQDGVLMKLRE